MNNLKQLLQVILPLVAVLLVLLAGVTFLAAIGPVLVPLGIAAVIILAAWIWLKSK